MLKKNPPAWSKEQTAAVKWLKKNLCNLPPLHIPTPEGKRILQTDASDLYWGAILLQEVNGRRLICGYTSGKFKDGELHYHSTYKEILAVKNGIKKFNFHLIGYEFLIELDMSAFPRMLEFKQKEIPSAQLLRWQQWFSRYNYKVKHIKGKDNVVADILSRPQATSKIPIMMMKASTSNVNPDPSDDPDLPPDIDVKQYPWDHEYLTERRTEWEVRLFRYYGGQMLQPFGISPKYPFAQVFIAQPENWPEELTWIFWYLGHEYHFLMEFHKPSIRKNWKDLSKEFIKFLSWFAEPAYWKMMMYKDPDYMIVHFHRPVTPIEHKHLQGFPEPFWRIHSQNGWSILEREEDYPEIQRYIFAQNKIIPKEVWPVEGFHYNDRPEFEIYYERIHSARDMYYYELRKAAEEQDAQDPFSMDNMQDAFEKAERDIYKSEWNKNMWRKKRKISGMDRYSWAAEKGYHNPSDYSTESDSISDEDSVIDLEFCGQWEDVKRSQPGWDPAKWKGTRFKKR